MHCLGIVGVGSVKSNRGALSMTGLPVTSLFSARALPNANAAMMLAQSQIAMTRLRCPPAM
jgi:hypothetical protein